MLEDMSREELEAYSLKLWYENENFKKALFGAKSERHESIHPDAQQLALELGETAAEQVEVVEEQQVSYTRKKTVKKEKKKAVRKPLPSHLERRVTVIEPSEETEGLVQIGTEVTEELEYQPGKLYVNRYERPKYAKGNGDGILIGSLPNRPIEKGIPGPGLLAHLVVSKYVDHLPLYRQAKMFRREGVELALSTLDEWVMRSATLLEPLYEALKKQVLSSGYIMADETPLPVLDQHKKKQTHRGYFWVYYSPEHRMVLFDYHPGRGKVAAQKTLSEYQGYLQTDGYKAYDEYEHKAGITLLACMAHARRKFVEAQHNDPDRANHVLNELQKLYAVEKQAREKEYSVAQRYTLRQKRAVKVMEDLYEWLIENRPHVLKQSPIGKAIDYTLGRWHLLKRYLDEGRVEIDNNLVENQIRPVALGRKNYLFAGSHSAAQKAAMIYSLVGSCEKNGVNPADYLRAVIERINEHHINQIQELLPQNINL